jgi:hypothetical protein
MTRSEMEQALVAWAHATEALNIAEETGLNLEAAEKHYQRCLSAVEVIAIGLMEQRRAQTNKRVLRLVDAGALDTALGLAVAMGDE